MSRGRVMAEMDRAAVAGQVALQHCPHCGALQYPPREVCVACLDDGLEWRITASVTGEVMATTVLHHSFDAALRDGLPLRVGLVRIESGPVAVCFLDPRCSGGDAVRLTAAVDGRGRAVLHAAPLGALA